MKSSIQFCLSIPALLLASAPAAIAHTNGPLNVTFTNCTEFAGVAPVDAARARALVPAPYALVTDANGAKLVVRVSDCAGIGVGGEVGLFSLPARPGRVAHIGIMIASPDGTATDPNTSLNNYTIAYASNHPALVAGLRRAGVPAALDAGLAYEFSPAQGTAELYAATAPVPGTGPTWFLHGTVTTPTIASTFLANWWYYARNREIKMATTFPTINFDFTSKVSFYTSRSNAIGQLLGSNGIANFPLSFRGQFPAARMAVTVTP
jgi:hypothetical protein